MSQIDALLCRFDGVKQTGRDTWIAKCSAHIDRSPSLSVREAEDGRILVHCFTGCATEDVLDSIGLTFSDLFPPKPENHRYKPIRKPFARVPREVLATLFRDLCIVQLAAKFVLQGADELSSFTDQDYQSLKAATGRISATLELSGMSGGGLRV